jgi:hypothetical protein
VFLTWGIAIRRGDISWTAFPFNSQARLLCVCERERRKGMGEVCQSISTGVSIVAVGLEAAGRLVALEVLGRLSSWGILLLPTMRP